MKVKTRETENAVIIDLEGEMMLGYEANDFHEAINLSIEKHKLNIVIDMCEVKFISSWGIGILIHGYTTSTNAGVSFKLACVPKKIKETFTKIKVDKIFQQFNSVEEALKN
ncbi:MAG: STAS domain-containing protein [Ignavibacteriaceae bacterium]|nr:STAS domain-containing protein [Ignavibacteriaceae bacterium]